MAQRFSPPEEIRQCLGLTEIQFRRAVRVKYRKSIDQWWNQHAATGRYILRQEQFEQARKGSVSALKWLGIQHLGQRQTVETLFKPGQSEGEEKKSEDVKGFAILTPQGMEPSAGGDSQASKLHDEVPVVEQTIQKELADEQAKEPEGNQPVIEVSGFPEENEAQHNI